ncbi:MAG: deoxyribose-phosphate aldolase [candidate division KSB1 bacterium]|nr:deoxyribose-phosphate aldolase [candidate division KSB1 bacterium]
MRTPADLAPYIDHANLRPGATPDEIRRLCEEALQYGFASVCVNPCYVPLCAELLRDSTVRVGTVIAFPFGASSPDQKVFEAKTVLRDGAREVDMVLNIGWLKGGKDEWVRKEIARVVHALGGRAILKVIIETCLLNEEEKVRAARIVEEAGGDYVKTSTGFNGPGATVEDVRLIRQTVSPRVGIKASGGIRDARTALEMLQAGASRIGTSSGVAIVNAVSF